MQAQAQKPNVNLSKDGSDTILQLSGDWVLQNEILSWDAFERTLRETQPEAICFNVAHLGEWDSSLMVFLTSCMSYAERNALKVDISALPKQIRNLLRLATSVPEKKDAHRNDPHCDPLTALGRRSIEWWNDFKAFLDFTGELTLAFWRFITFRSNMRMREFWKIIQQVGSEALPIVSLISFLVGIIIAFLGAVVLLKFRAEFAVAYLVGYGMLREMGAIMTGVIMAGRTGSAFAAEIGSMKVNEELDAMKTMGIRPMDYIVMPRSLALVLMMPLLTLYADLIGIFGGYMVSVWMLDIPSAQFFHNMNAVAGLPDLFLGLIKGGVFGVLIAMSGCLRGMLCGSSSDSVGKSTTQAVVMGITLIIFFNALIDWIAAIYSI